MPHFTDVVEAFQKARSRAAIAAYAEANLLHIAVADGKALGLNRQEVARMLRVPVADVKRHWRDGHKCESPAPVWGNRKEYLTTQRHIWSHVPERFATEESLTGEEEFVQFEWIDGRDGSRSMITRISSEK